MIFFIMSAAVLIGLFLYFTLEPIDNVQKHGHVVLQGVEFSWRRRPVESHWIKVEGQDFEGRPTHDFHDTDANYDNYKIGDAYPR